MLKRDLNKIKNSFYDLIIIGGGIFGACAAWDAALRGLSVVLLEKKDFSGATSANHFKMVHGGIRYLQHGDIKRVRESCRERSALLRVAQHLVKPLQILIPTYGHGKKGLEILRMGTMVYDILTFDRNRDIDDKRKIPKSEFLKKSEVLGHFPGLNPKGLTGGVVFCDGQVYNSPRLAISFLHSAAGIGADMANYLEVSDFIEEKKSVCGVKVKDLLTKDEFKVKGKYVLNSTGPWGHRLLQSLGIKVNKSPVFSRDFAFLINKKIHPAIALACPTKSFDNDAVLDRGGRHLFLVPWRDFTLVGVWHKIFHKIPEKITVSHQELQEYIDEINRSYPGAGIGMKNVTMINTGLTLYGDEENQKGRMSFGKRSLLIDHAREDNLKGLMTIIGVRATMARGMAKLALDKIIKTLGKGSKTTKTHLTPIHGSDLSLSNTVLNNPAKLKHYPLPLKVFNSLILTYGSRYEEVLKYIDENESLTEIIGNSDVIKAQVVHGIREEMAVKLNDIIFRRTDLGTGQYPGKDAIKICADIMAEELSWDQTSKKREIDEVYKAFPMFNHHRIGLGCKQ